MIKGLRTVIYAVKDLEAGKNWYSKVLGIKPYFDQPFRVMDPNPEWQRKST